MTTYEVVFDDVGAGRPALQPGELVEIGGERWQVEAVASPDADGVGTGGAGRIRLVRPDPEDDEVAAHIRLPRPLRAPTSFESELVYTLNDLATRLSSLAQVLSAYWGKDAA
jgi:hypothetical protein